jgi:CheY-like chemotaxis protein
MAYSAGNKERTRWNTGKVLVVDDDAVVGRSIDRVLTEQGARVSTAHDGEEAIRRFGHENYDLVFADIKMPGMDGLEVTSRLKEMNPGTPVVIITGYGTEAAEARAEELGVEAFIHKPLTPDVVVEIAERVLAARKRKELTTATAAVTAAPAEERESVAKNLAMFFAAPFIGLAYIIAFPFVGLYAIAKVGLKAAGQRIGMS